MKLKRVIAAILTAMMILCVLPTGIALAEDTPQDYESYRYLRIRVLDKDTNAEIPLTGSSFAVVAQSGDTRISVDENGYSGKIETPANGKTHTVKMLTAPNNYIIDKSTVVGKLSVEKKDGYAVYTYAFTCKAVESIYGTPNKGVALANVRVRVFDVVTGKRVSVSGAKFEVLYNDVSMGSIATDTSGTAVIKDLLANPQQRIFLSASTGLGFSKVRR